MRLPALSTTAFIATSLILLSACAKRETQVEKGIRTHTLLVGNGGEPTDLDPHITANAIDVNIQMALFEGLTSFDEKSGRAVPAAAERWECSPDGLTWTFHLRAGLAWSNGDLLTADDFVQSWRRALTPAVASTTTYLYFAVNNAEAFSKGQITDPAALGFAAPDPRTVVITLARPTPILPMFAATPAWFPINPRVLARFDGLTKRAPTWTRPGNLVGNGPFTLTEWQPNARIVVTKNPRYWDAARTSLERIMFFPIESVDVEERNYRAGQLHVTRGLPPGKVAGYRERAPDQLRINPELTVTFLSFNCGQPPFDNPKLRRALALGIDREVIARSVLLGTVPPAHSFVPNPCGDYVSRARIESDFEAARRMLADAGYPGGRGLPAFPVQTDSTSIPVAEALQAMWKKELGVTITVESLELKTLWQNQETKTYWVGLVNFVADFADPGSLLDCFSTGNAYNSPGWSSPTYDRLLAQGAQTTDPAARLEFFQSAEALLLAESSVAPIVFKNKIRLIHPAVKGWEASPISRNRYQLIRLER
jgi:oligopeptide transport system substrate-binding protein